MINGPNKDVLQFSRMLQSRTLHLGTRRMKAMANTSSTSVMFASLAPVWFLKFSQPFLKAWSLRQITSKWTDQASRYIHKGTKYSASLQLNKKPSELQVQYILLVNLEAVGALYTVVSPSTQRPRF